MFNLLPKAEKEAIRREYRTRLVVVVLWLSFATLLIAAALLVPSFLLSAGKAKAAERRFATLSESVEHANEADLDTVLRDAKNRLALLRRTPPKTSLHEAILHIAEQKGARVSLTSFSFAGESEGKRQVSIAGVAIDRTSLLAFAKALERVGLFEKVEVPISNFAKDTDIEFSIHTTGTF